MSAIAPLLGHVYVMSPWQKYPVVIIGVEPGKDSWDLMLTVVDGHGQVQLALARHVYVDGPAPADWTPQNLREEVASSV